MYARSAALVVLGAVLLPGTPVSSSGSVSISAAGGGAVAGPKWDPAA